jgi:hypothetical protein
MTVKYEIARLLRLWADHLDPAPEPMVSNVEFVAGLKREAAEWSMADECEAIKREQEQEDLSRQIDRGMSIVYGRNLKRVK